MTLRTPTKNFPGDVTGKLQESNVKKSNMAEVIKKKLKIETVSWRCTAQQSVRSLRTFQKTRPASPKLPYSSNTSGPQVQVFKS